MTNTHLDNIFSHIVSKQPIEEWAGYSSKDIDVLSNSKGNVWIKIMGKQSGKSVYP